MIRFRISLKRVATPQSPASSILRCYPHCITEVPGATDTFHKDLLSELKSLEIRPNNVTLSLRKVLFDMSNVNF